MGVGEFIRHAVASINNIFTREWTQKHHNENMMRMVALAVKRGADDSRKRLDAASKFFTHGYDEPTAVYFVALHMRKALTVMAEQRLVVLSRTYPIEIWESQGIEFDKNGFMVYRFHLNIPKYGEVEIILSTDHAGPFTPRWMYGASLRERLPVIYYATIVPPKHRHKSVRIPIRHLILLSKPTR